MSRSRRSLPRAAPTCPTDGRLVAVGDHDTERPDLLPVDLATGDVDGRPLSDGAVAAGTRCGRGTPRV